ncbi:MAG TPA: helix-turn-helix transcriptional regulator [Luteitalea sp.]|nr:helix-turn-helix transcriptional regulator [Luteitalea sp.]
MSSSIFGARLREWRVRRHLSQLALACDAGISTRHLSFMESGRALPSREMILRLAEQLEIPLRERNELLLGAGFAPLYAQHGLGDQALRMATEAVDRILAAHEPFPGLAIDRHWTMVRANSVVAPLLAGVAPHLLAPPVNVMRLSLAPDGLLPQIVNAAEWRQHLLTRLARQARETADSVLHALLEELRGLSAPADVPPVDSVIVPLRLRTPAGELSFISTTLVFGHPMDVTLSELAVELFFPADETTGDVLRTLAAAQRA